MSSIQEIVDLPVANAQVAATAAGTPYAATALVGVAPCKGTVVGVRYIPGAGITADPTNFQTLTVRNTGVDAADTTAVATRAWSAVNSVADTPESMTLGVAANLEVKEGDRFGYVSAVSGTGVALPAGTIIVSIRPHR